MSAKILLLLPLLAKATTFIPENGALLSNDGGVLPCAYSLAESQTKNVSSVGSFWSSSFLHASDDHDYMVVSHVIQAPGFPNGSNSMYRASVLDITDLSRYSQFEVFTNATNFFGDNGELNATIPGYGFGSIGLKNGNPALRTWSSGDSGAQFDLSFELSSAPLLNGGLGSFEGSGSLTNEWAAPAGKTTGWVSLNGSKATVDSARSLTWYDRQWNGAPTSWTWFEIHVENESFNEPATPLSIWTYNTTSGLGGFATTRLAAGVHTVASVASITPSKRTYTSKATGVVYSLDWTLQLGDGTKFFISSVRADQELYATGGVYPTYEGYIDVSGVRKNGQPFKGFGLVEVVPGA